MKGTSGISVLGVGFQPECESAILLMSNGKKESSHERNRPQGSDCKGALEY
jgi:hypothetical protein